MFSLLAASTKSFFLPTFVLADLLSQHPPRDELSFRVTVLAETCNLCQSESGLEDPHLVSDKSDGGPELCNPQSGAPALTHLARVAMRSDQHLHLRPRTHSSLTPAQVNRSPLSHPRLFPAASFHHWSPACPLQPSLLHPQARVSHSSFYLTSCCKGSLFLPLPSLTRYKLRFIPTQTRSFFWQFLNHPNSL